MKRLLTGVALALLLLPFAARPASAHPLGNYTVNRAVDVTIAAGEVTLLYLVDMAEIPAFSEIEQIDVDGDRAVSRGEADGYATPACERALRNLDLRVDEEVLPLAVAAPPSLELLPGAGGLPTLRLTCRLDAELPVADGGTLTVVDHTDDGHVGWREVTIAAAYGVRISDADVPEQSESAYLTAYPAGRLESPPDVRKGQAAFSIAEHAVVPPSGALNGSAAPARPADPLASLLEGELSPAVIALALLLAGGLGAAHAVSPGHGKTLVAAYLVGSGGSMRQAVGLGLTVAFTHTAGVLALGAIILLAGDLLLPETLIGWLTIASGGLMAFLGAGLLWKGFASRRAGHAHEHDHAHGRQHHGPHPHAHTSSPAGERERLGARNVAALGLAGGLVPSASALIVLLAAVTTGRLAFGLALIAAFGAGMALVLGGLAAATVFARSWLDRGGYRQGWLVRRALGVLPIGSGALVLGIGVAITITALGRMS